MRKPTISAALLALLSACASTPAHRPGESPDLRQYPGDREDSSPAAPAPAAPPSPAKPQQSLKGMRFEAPAGWDEVTEQAPHPPTVIAVFMHDGPPLGIIAVDVLHTGDQPMKAVLRQLSRDIEDAKVILRSDVSADGLRGSMSWTASVDGSGSSGHGELVRFPGHDGVTVAFLGFWNAKDHDRHKPSVQAMAGSVVAPGAVSPAK